MSRALPLALLVLAGVVFPAAADGPLAGVLSLLPADTEAFIAVSNLDRAGDDIDTALLAMDRAGLLVGSRPVDLLKSTLGMNTAVDDFGAGAAALLPRPDGGTAPVLIVPVTDAAIFIEANFVPGDADDQVRQVDGTVYYWRRFDAHVVIGHDAEIMRTFTPAPDFLESIRTGLGTDAWARLRRGDIIAFARPPAIRRFAAGDGRDGTWLSAARAILRSAAPLINSLDFAAWSVEIDPLALIVHEEVRFRPGTAIAQHSRGGTSAIRGLSAIGDRPHYVAGAIDLAGFGGREAASARTRALGWPALPEWTGLLDGAHFAACAEPSAPGSGMLGEAYAVLESRDPTALMTVLATSIRQLAARDDGIARTVTFENAPPAIGADFSFAVHAEPGEASRSPLAAYFPSLVGTGPRDQRRLAVEQAINALAFGPEGWRGYLGNVGDRIIITFGQRPGLWRDAVAAAGGQAATLDESFVVQTMRGWMPLQPDVELYVDAGRVLSSFRPLLRLLSRGDSSWPAAVDPSLPPIGIAAKVQDGGARTTTVIPAGVLAVVIDRLGERIDPRKAPIDGGGP